MLIYYVSLNSHNFFKQKPHSNFPTSRSSNFMEMEFKETRLNEERTLRHVHISCQ